MDQSLNVPIFPASVAVTSLSGVMMPGPVMAVTVAKGKKWNCGSFDRSRSRRARFKTKDSIETDVGNVKFSAVFSGLAATSANPYFFLWWATIGSALVVNSTILGITGFLLFALTHWFCDFFWYLFVSRAVYRSRNLWNLKVHRIVFGLCSSILLVFGVWFVCSAMK